MSTLIFPLAGVAALIGILLFVLDARRRRTPGPAQSPAPEAEPDMDELFGREEPEQEWADAHPAATDPAPASAAEREPEEPSEDWAAPAAPAEEQAAPAAEPTPAPAPAESPSPGTGAFGLPVTQRRERRTWAEAHGWDFARQDPYLDDEWTRGAAASGAAPKDVVRGMIGGYEMYLASLGGTPVMALRRGEASEVVVDMRRPGMVAQSSEDLLPAGNVAGFDVLATDVGPAERMVDPRVRRALHALPPTVTAVWLESDWAIAELERGSHQDTWEAVAGPLGLIADASRMLPPRGPAGTPPVYPPEHPSRLMPPPPTPEEEFNPAEPDITATPLVIRPEEPADMPSRSQPESRGVVEPRPLGGDEVEAIAGEGSPRPAPNPDAARILRDLSSGSTIFDDLAEELGTDPLSDRAREEDDYS
ncbi:hypothetical protein L1O03_08820 [Corynebacterium uropygiale]|uniref:Uncharacterized protein n=1 Tax=Corynebacterium uropygiale TaxID=1775911 RepID=A0A9X1QUL4_9CORY|nr:hypothetical protein [Corynebacterium uropygiale]MCF4007275.1 hypothetical protein [Corynebacterium uropygiale]